MNTPNPHSAQLVWYRILSSIQANNTQYWRPLQHSRAVNLAGSELTVELPEKDLEMVLSQMPLGYINRMAGCMGLGDLKVTFKQAPEPPITPSYYLVTDACTGEHLGFPSISLIEAHLKLAGIGSEWPAVALLAHRMGDKSGNHRLWQAAERDAKYWGVAVKLIQVGKE